ncbi:MAG: 3-methylornithyl-N6-L-lysine dehydrogenase PylD [Thermoplasmatales archaeon]|nr:3-methylornithyl-N6-L-lysine dehydrogenase PylD [Thermoplasmatales archaeon]
MTRLTADNLDGFFPKIHYLDGYLEETTGLGLRALACEAAGVAEADIDFDALSVAVVPVTSGKGVIRGFSETVAETIRSLGIDTVVTDACDVAGVAEAVSHGFDIVLMADDDRFIAVDRKRGVFSDNVWSTARGYVTALRLAAGGSLEGMTVLIIGAGRVGGTASTMLLEEGARVEVVDIRREKTERLARNVPGIVPRFDLAAAISENLLILNASPGKISGRNVREGAIISSPGVPYAFDGEGEAKAKKIIHDILGLGVAVMVVSAANPRDSHIREEIKLG